MPRAGDERHGRSCRNAAAAWPPHSVVGNLSSLSRGSVAVHSRFAAVALLVITAKAINYFRAWPTITVWRSAAAMPPLCYARPCRAPVTSGMAALAGMQRRHGRRTPLSAICHLLSCGSVAVHSRVGRGSLRRCTARNYGESDQILPRV